MEAAICHMKNLCRIKRVCKAVERSTSRTTAFPRGTSLSFIRYCMAKRSGFYNRTQFLSMRNTDLFDYKKQLVILA